MSALRLGWPTIMLGAAAILLILPLWLAGTPAMPDYPARLAGFYLIGGGAETSPLSSFYGIAWAPIPNLAAEAIVPMLARLMPLETAARLFLSVGVAMWVAGPALIHRALYRRIGLAPLAASFFAYNVNFMWGFFNYYFAAGLCLIAFAGWIASAAWKRITRIAVFAAACVLLYFCHILGAALFLLLIAAFEAGRRPLSLRTSLMEVVLVALPVAALYLLKPGGAPDDGISFNLLGTFLPRMASLVQRHFAAPAYLPLIGLALLFALGMWRRKISIHPQMRLVLIAIALLALLSPETAMGGWGLHLRFPAIAAALLFASCEISLSRKFACAVAAGILSTLGWMSAALAGQWRAYDRQIDEFRASLSAVPRGAHLMTAIDEKDSGEIPHRLYWHIAEFAIIDRSASTALMFATGGQHIVTLKPAVAGFAAHTARNGTPPDMGDLDALAAGKGSNSKIRDELGYLRHFPCHYDEIVLIHANGRPRAVPAMLSLRHQGSFFALYDVRPSRGCSTSSATRP